MDTELSFGQWLKRRRLGMGMTQDELGHRIGYSGVSIRKVEADERRPSYEMAEKLAQALALAPEERTAFIQFARDEKLPVPLPATVTGVPLQNPPPALRRPPTNLPLQLTSFVGREREMERLQAMLDVSRLVTLTGVGGTGKTRLALEVGAARLDHYPNGVWLVELAPLMDPALLPRVVARTLNVPDEVGRPLLDTLTDYLRAKHLLLILDNCEHLIETCAQLVKQLLRGCPPLQVLATSREGLNIEGETNFHVPSLASPDPNHLPALDSLTDYAAVRLFVDRAVATTPDFTVTSHNAAAVAQVCARLDGMPLAIELAAARVRVLKVEQIAARLDDRFRLLTGGSRTALPRQQTLQALIDWSYSLLTEEERALLRQLSVFSGGWTLEAAEAVCAGDDAGQAGVLDLLTRLVDKSLVVVDAAGEETRYHLLETIRQYAQDKLLEVGEGDRVRDRHVTYFLKLAEDSEIYLHGPQQSTWMKRLAAEADNLRTALGRSVASEQGLRLARALTYFWWLHTASNEGIGWLEAVLKQTEALGATALRGRVVWALGFLSDRGSSRTRFQESLTIARNLGDVLGQASALQELGYVEVSQNHLIAGAELYAESQALFNAAGVTGVTPETEMLYLLQGDLAMTMGDDAAARAIYEQGLASLRKSGDYAWAAAFNSHLAWLEEGQGNYDVARRGYAERLAIAHQMNSAFNILESLRSLVRVMLKQGDYAAAASHAGEGLARARELGLQDYVFQFTVQAGEVAWLTGHKRQARALYTESLTMAREMKEHYITAYLLRAWAAQARTRGRAVEAVQAWGAAAAIPSPHAHHLGSFPATYEEDLRAARSQLGDAAFEAAWAAGQAMTLEQAIGYALAIDTQEGE